MVGAIIRAITELRLEWAQEAVRNPNRESPEFAYGEAAGRDVACQVILEKIQSLIAEDEEEE